MSKILRYGTAIFVVIFAIIILNYIRKNKLNLKYALVWLALLLIMFIALLVPHLLEFLAKILGFELVSNMIFLCAIIVLLCITFSLTIIISRQANSIRLLTQEISILKSHIRGDN